jgi:hypothetical protein
MSACRVEAFFDTIEREFGWQCFTCGDEDAKGFLSYEAAEVAGEKHRVEVATQQLIDDGELP